MSDRMYINNILEIKMVISLEGLGKNIFCIYSC